MKPKMPPARFVKKATPRKSEEKTESKRERTTEKKNPALEKAEKKPAEKKPAEKKPAAVKVKIKIGGATPDVYKYPEDRRSKEEISRRQAENDAEVMQKHAEIVSDKIRHHNAKAHLTDKVAKIRLAVGEA
jgi:hypothetical protein